MDAAAITAMASRLEALRLSLGKDAHVSISVSAHGWCDGRHAHLSIWPGGIGGSASKHFSGHTFEEVLEQGEAAVLAIRDERREATIRAMSQRILEVTAEQGGCEEADLAVSFSAAEIAELRDAAVRRALELARRMRAGLEVVV